MSRKVPLYDSFSNTYDIMVSWPQRLERESPFFEKAFKRVGARRVLDVACGTGMHAIHFASLGLEVVGADPSSEMLRKARQNASGSSGVSFVQAGFTELSGKVSGAFDVVTCLGNSLPHVSSEEELLSALLDIAAVLRPGGILILQQLNYDRILAERKRFLGLSSGTDGADEVLFFRFYDFGDPTLTFNVTRFRKTNGAWTYEVDSTELYPIRRSDIEKCLPQAGFGHTDFYGDYDEHPFDVAASNDLIVAAALESLAHQPTEWKVLDGLEIGSESSPGPLDSE